MAKNYTRYRATISSPGMVPYHLYGKSLPRWRAKLAANRRRHAVAFLLFPARPRTH